MKTGSKNLIFWGAGATASLGFRMTKNQAETIFHLVEDESKPTSKQRIKEALKDADKWTDTFLDLLLILGDNNENTYYITDEAREAMQRHWSDQSTKALDERIHELRALYDWPALKGAIRICPGFSTTPSNKSRFQIQDIFNVLDLHSVHGFPAKGGRFLPPSRLIAARRALQMLLNALFYVDWQTALNDEDKRRDLIKHLEFARLLAEHHQQIGLKKAANQQCFDNRDFYLGNIAFVSLNYDPVALWAQFIANKKANENPPYIGSPCNPLKIFHDFGIFMALSSINRKDANKSNLKERVWYPLNEASAQRLNDRDYQTRRVRINKFLFPHGCLCWRECPSCGKLSAYMGKDWEIDTPALIPPPPLRGFKELAHLDVPYETDDENDAWKRGEVDARECVHCNQMTYAHHTTTLMQSNFKAKPPSFIEEIERDLRVATQAANHIIFMGYSLPPDDVAYRAFLSARKQRPNKNNQVLRCSVVVGQGLGERWMYPQDIDEIMEPKCADKSPHHTTLESARDIFGRDNVRFYGHGIPQVFCMHNQVSRQAFQKLFNWEETT